MQARAVQVGKGFSEFLCRLVSRSEGPRIVLREMYCIEHSSSIVVLKYLPLYFYIKCSQRRCFTYPWHLFTYKLKKPKACGSRSKFSGDRTAMSIRNQISSFYITVALRVFASDYIVFVVLIVFMFSKTTSNAKFDVFPLTQFPIRPCYFKQFNNVTSTNDEGLLYKISKATCSPPGFPLWQTLLQTWMWCLVVS